MWSKIQIMVHYCLNIVIEKSSPVHRQVPEWDWLPSIYVGPA